MSQDIPALVVLGSVNTDYTIRVDHYPAPGETILGTGLHVRTGGKGANQAVAAARLGARTFFVGAVGPDPQGRRLLADLRAAQVDVSRVAVSAHHPSGVAFITVTPDGQNSIVVGSGANLAVDPVTAAKAAGVLLVPDAVLVMQAELPAETVDAAARVAADRRARVVLNQAPFRALSERTLRLCDPLVVNAGEVSALLGRRVATVAEAAGAAAELAQTCRSVVVTLGADGAVIASDGAVSHLRALTVDAVDSSGAGDAFVGALGARLLAGNRLGEAARWASAAGAAAVSTHGAGGFAASTETLKSLVSSLPAAVPLPNASPVGS